MHEYKKNELSRVRRAWLAALRIGKSGRIVTIDADALDLYLEQLEIAEKSPLRFETALEFQIQGMEQPMRQGKEMETI